MIDIKKQAELYAAHVIANDIKTLTLFPLKKRMNAQQNEFRLSFFQALARNLNDFPMDRRWGEKPMDTLARLSEHLTVLGYQIIEADMSDYDRKLYKADIEAEINQLEIAA